MTKITIDRVYVEVAFWLSTISGALGLISESITSYPGDLLSQDVIVVIGIVQLITAFVAGAVLRRQQT